MTSTTWTCNRVWKIWCVCWIWCLAVGVHTSVTIFISETYMYTSTNSFLQAWTLIFQVTVFRFFPSEFEQLVVRGFGSFTFCLVFVVEEIGVAILLRRAKSWQIKNAPIFLVFCRKSACCMREKKEYEWEQKKGKNVSRLSLRREGIIFHCVDYIITRESPTSADIWTISVK